MTTVCLFKMVEFDKTVLTMFFSLLLIKTGRPMMTSLIAKVCIAVVFVGVVLLKHFVAIVTTVFGLSVIDLNFLEIRMTSSSWTVTSTNAKLKISYSLQNRLKSPE